MAHSIAIPEYHAEVRASSRQRANLRNLLLIGAVIGALALVSAVSTFELVRAASPAESAAMETATSSPAPELPREWRWSPPAGNYDSMYRGVEPQRLDWIRGSGRP